MNICCIFVSLPLCLFPVGPGASRLIRWASALTGGKIAATPPSFSGERRHPSNYEDDEYSGAGGMSSGGGGGRTGGGPAGGLMPVGAMSPDIDRLLGSSPLRHRFRARRTHDSNRSVSYTHLTLPTICSV